MPKTFLATHHNPVLDPRDCNLGQRNPIHRQKIQRIPRGAARIPPFQLGRAPQTNGQVESANKIIVKGLKKRLDDAKGLWADKLGSVLWLYRTIPQTATGETPFRLTYGVEAIIPLEIGDPSPRRTIGGNDEKAERDLTDEVRSIAHIRELALKQRISLRYNHGVVRREFVPDDLVLRRKDIGTPTPGEGKLTPTRRARTKSRQQLEREHTSSNDLTATRSRGPGTPPTYDDTTHRSTL
ncbi:uncharacterized protein LOC107641313 [Arachis ipaensis]|uniref:uncharacterized protein LOC107637180 n=1 Tax=Arachis ipaensis TaxID=130454 RepID=UPI0007AF7859|nr:uncharacterized protein LOC107637180 [Arachis ipaensis]XP_016200296.1 uncharacterized protein LOC107641313 [Arachis ipaensis]XP_025648248.1 uncharacterized protein LOC112743244 [Arachis hypogaea]